jgi:hypothetical protein
MTTPTNPDPEPTSRAFGTDSLEETDDFDVSVFASVPAAQAAPAFSKASLLRGRLAVLGALTADGLAQLGVRIADWLADRGDDLRRALGGWQDTEPWIKATLGGAGLLGAVALGGSLLTLMVQGLVDLVHQAGGIHIAAGAHTGLLATITSSVWAYLRSHTTGLPATPATVYAIWQLAVAGSGIASFATRALGARLAWLLAGASTGWMTWHGAPASGREVAVGLVALAWTLLSIPALRGARLFGRL